MVTDSHCSRSIVLTDPSMVSDPDASTETTAALILVTVTSKSPVSSAAAVATAGKVTVKGVVAWLPSITDRLSEASI
jgi:hypothetical protein